MSTGKGISHLANALVLAAAGILLNSPAEAATITVSSTVSGTTPQVLGYNLGHFVAGSNAADYWRYTGASGARAFISVSHVEPSDDIAPVGDNVSDGTSFNARKAALRSNVRSDPSLLSTAYINWPMFKKGYATPDTGSNNLMSIDYAFGALRRQGAQILANISCSPSRFPLASDADWPNRWEIWQHYYAQAYYLAKTYDVSWFGVMNEPNNWAGVTPEDWFRRLRVASDAIQAAIEDVNAAAGKSLAVKIFAPNTANGASKYDSYATGDYWGQLATRNRHLALDGSMSPSWWNFNVYNYQKYSTLQNSTASASGYIDDYNLLKSKIAADIAPEALPIALTEFNSRTGSSYDGITNNADTPADYAALGASLVALARAEQLYLFKFGMTEAAGTYPVAKNGTHYVDNVSALRPYGGPSSTAEVYRLFNKAARGGRSIYTSSGAPPDVWSLATRDGLTGTTYIFVANKTTSAVPLDVAVSSLGVANGSSVTVEEVSSAYRGAVRVASSVALGKVPSLSMPAQSVWLISIDASTSAATTIRASDNATLKDGAGRNTPGGGLASLTARADGTANGRQVSVIKFPLPAWQALPRRVLLSLQASTISRAGLTQVHIYGVETDTWTEGGATFSSLAPQLKQNIGPGAEIANNVVEDSRSSVKFLGQVLVSGTAAAERLLDVSDFVRAQADGYASFLVVQEHRWGKANQLNSGAGDLQADGIKITSRSSATKGPLLRVYPR